jgi:hypothetical protein
MSSAVTERDLGSQATSPRDKRRPSRHHYGNQAFHPFQPQPGLARPLIDLDPWCASQHELPSPAVDEYRGRRETKCELVHRGEICSRRPFFLDIALPEKDSSFIII